MFVATVLAAVAALLAAFWYYFSRNFGYWTERGVVSCNPFSLTGDRGGGIPFGKPFYELLTPIYNKYKGKERVVGTFQARRPILVALDPEVTKAVLTKDFSHFHGRGQPTDESDPFSQNLFFLEGARWKNLRMKLSPTFTSGKLKGMFPLMAGITDQLNDAVREKAAHGDKQVEFKDILLRYSTDVIGSVAFGIDCNTVKGGNDDFLNMSRELFRRNFIFLLRFFLISVHPVFVKLLPFKRIFKDMTEFFLKLMSDTVNYREKNKVERNDFVQIMMQLREEDRNRSTLDRASHVELNNDTMAAQAFLFFVAGLDNVANTIGFALHELAMNHALQRRAVAEIQENIRKHGSLTYDAVRDMELIERIVRESLRKYSPVGILTRQPSEPIKIPDSDVVIDPSVMVWIPVWQAMHDPDIFPEPERFDPDRFTEEAKKTRHQYNYLPFGEGPRFCVAERFAILEMKLCIAGLLQQHAFDAGSKTDVKLKLDPKTSSPTPQNGFWLQVTDRPTSAL
nr:cytochrome P450 [Thrips tabaci]